MNAEQLRAMQSPFKEKYRADPAAAAQILVAEGTVDFERLAVKLTNRAAGPRDPGMHPSTGGNGTFACAAEMLLEALVGCAGVTLSAVCTSMAIPVKQVRVVARGYLDFRGTLGVNREVPVGFTRIVLQFLFDSTGTDEQLAKAMQLSERYCVVAQTLKHVECSWSRIP